HLIDARCGFGDLADLLHHGIDQVLTISGISVLDNNASLQNAGVAYVVLKDWDESGKQKGQDLLSIYQHLNGALQNVLA
ncbi:hypothetical protein, partial [Rhizobium johnstonii]|uniref:hypothetical protein n=1 Tax=Rhizobium johnstonii TaxID=3019933 RepID=UPI003F9451F9